MSADNGVRRAQMVLAVAVSAMALVAALAGGVYAWSDVRYRTLDHERRIQRIEAALADQNYKLDLILLEVKKEAE